MQLFEFNWIIALTRPMFEKKDWYCSLPYRSIRVFEDFMQVMLKEFNIIVLYCYFSSYSLLLSWSKFVLWSLDINGASHIQNDFQLKYRIDCQIRIL